MSDSCMLRYWIAFPFLKIKTRCLGWIASVLTFVGSFVCWVKMWPILLCVWIPVRGDARKDGTITISTPLLQRIYFLLASHISPATESLQLHCRALVQWSQQRRCITGSDGQMPAFNNVRGVVHLPSSRTWKLCIIILAMCIHPDKTFTHKRQSTVLLKALLN